MNIFERHNNRNKIERENRQAKFNKNLCLKIVISISLVLLISSVMLYATIDNLLLPTISSTGRINILYYILMLLCLPIVLMWLPEKIKNKSAKQKIFYGTILWIILVSLILLITIGLAILAVN